MLLALASRVQDESPACADACYDANLACIEACDGSDDPVACLGSASSS